MPSNAIILRNLCKLRNFSSSRRFTSGKIVLAKQKTTPTNIRSEVPGLSQAVVDIPNEPVGPGAAKNTQYKNPEYFCYNKNSFFEAEIEMAKYRLPQPSVKEYYKPSSE